MFLSRCRGGVRRRISLAHFSTGCWSIKRSHGCSGDLDSHQIELGLELGVGGSAGKRVIGRKESYGFTILQLQSLIYKYIEDGFPVPYHLVVPLWKSIGSSLDGLTCFYQFYPNFKEGKPSCMEYKIGVDIEPGRCRRTGGKKWRCSKEAVTEQKYCERHMHRGRQRSRKLVDSPSTNLSISLPASN